MKVFITYLADWNYASKFVLVNLITTYKDTAHLIYSNSVDYVILLYGERVIEFMGVILIG